MDNTIKPPGGRGPFPDTSVGDSVESQRQTGFGELKDRLETSDSAAVPGSSLRVATQFRKAELQDPAKLEGMVRSSVSELIEASEKLTGPLSANEKQSLLDFLSQDPIVRRQVESYLRKVLS